MMKKYATLLLSVIVLVCTFEAFAQTPNLNALTFKRKNQKNLVLPFEFVSNLIIIPVQINDSDTMRFILDSGVNSTIITEINIGNTLSLNYARKVQLRGLGEGNDLEALHSFGNQFNISGIQGQHQHVFVLLEDIFHLSTKLGMRVHGIIGYSLFRDFVITINYDRKRIVFTKPKKFKLSKKDQQKAVTLPLEIEKTKPYVNASIVQTDGVEVPVKLFIDTGGSHPLWLDEASSEDLHVPEKSLQAYLGRGLNGEINGKIGRIKSLKLGKYILDDLTAAFPDTASAHIALGLHDRNGSLGSEVLKRFRVSIDYSRKQITFRPTDKFYEPFHYNLSGIEVSAPMPELPYFVISSVRVGSPADSVGLKKGDQIISINGKLARDYKLNEINELFYSKPGRKVKIRVVRDKEHIKTEFVLKKAI